MSRIIFRPCPCPWPFLETCFPSIISWIVSSVIVTPSSETIITTSFSLNSKFIKILPLPEIASAAFESRFRSSSCISKPQQRISHSSSGSWTWSCIVSPVYSLLFPMRSPYSIPGYCFSSCITVKRRMLLSLNRSSYPGFLMMSSTRLRFVFTLEMKIVSSFFFGPAGSRRIRFSTSSIFISSAYNSCTISPAEPNASKALSALPTMAAFSFTPINSKYVLIIFKLPRELWPCALRYQRILSLISPEIRVFRVRFPARTCSCKMRSMSSLDFARCRSSASLFS